MGKKTLRKALYTCIQLLLSSAYDCGDFPYLTESYIVEGDGFDEQDYRTIRCQEGYSAPLLLDMNGLETDTTSKQDVYCENGSWQNILLLCEQQCEEYVKYDNILVEGEGLSSGSIRILSCSNGREPAWGNNGDTVQCVDGLWTKKSLQCELPCTAPTDLLSNATYRVMSSVNAASFPPRSKLFYQCSNSQEVATQPKNYIQCIDGGWTPVNLLCELDCKPYTPPVDNDGMVVVGSGNKNGDSRVLSCKENYSGWNARIKNDETEEIKCENGIWTRSLFQCKKNCDKNIYDPYDSPMFVAKGTGYRHNDQRLLSCANGYRPSTRTLASILSSSSPPLLPASPSASATPSPVLASQEVSVLTKCNNGRWDEPRLECKKECDFLPSLGSEYLILGGSNPLLPQLEGTVISVVCQEGFVSTLPSLSLVTSICMNTSWSPLPLTCVQSCPALSTFALPLGIAIKKDVSIDTTLPAPHGQIVHVECEDSYSYYPPEKDDLDGKTLLCNEGEWLFPVSLCKKGCSLPSLPISLSISPPPQSILPLSSPYLHGDEIEVTCAPSFNPLPNALLHNLLVTLDPSNNSAFYDSLTCLDGDWTPPLLRCAPTCDPLFEALPLLKQGYEIIPQSYQGTDRVFSGYGVLLRCQEGYSAVHESDSSKEPNTSEEYIGCEDGQWTTPSLVCVPLCETPYVPLSSNAYLLLGTDTKGRHNDVVLVSCGPGYVSRSFTWNVQAVRCRFGLWENDSLECALGCGELRLEGVAEDQDSSVVVKYEGEKPLLGATGMAGVGEVVGEAGELNERTVSALMLYLEGSRRKGGYKKGKTLSPALQQWTVQFKQQQYQQLMLFIASLYQQLYVEGEKTVTPTTDSSDTPAASESKNLEDENEAVKGEEGDEEEDGMEEEKKEEEETVEKKADDGEDNKMREEAYARELQAKQDEEIMEKLKALQKLLESSASSDGEENGRVHREGVVAMVRCSPGFYSLFDYEKSVCIQGNWTEVQMKCYKQCKPLPLLDRKKYAVQQLPLLGWSAGQERRDEARERGEKTISHIRLHCNENYSSAYLTQGKGSELICQKDGQWSLLEMNCYKKCLPYKDYDKETMMILYYDSLGVKRARGDDYYPRHGESVYVTCKSPYMNLSPNQSHLSTCINGIWTPPNQLQCQNYCTRDPLLIPKEAYVLYDDLSQGENKKSPSIYYPGYRKYVRCAEGYATPVLINSFTAPKETQSSSQDNTTPEETPDIGKVTQGEDTSISPSPDQAVLLCTHGGWSRINLLCEPLCPSFTLPPNTTHQLLSSASPEESLRYGATRTIQCKDTFTSIDSNRTSEKLFCINGQWTLPTLSCEKAQCDPIEASLPPSLISGSPVSLSSLSLSLPQAQGLIEARPIKCQPGYTRRTHSLIDPTKPSYAYCYRGQWRIDMLLCMPSLLYKTVHKRHTSWQASYWPGHSIRNTLSLREWAQGKRLGPRNEERKGNEKEGSSDGVYGMIASSLSREGFYPVGHWFDLMEKKILVKNEQGSDEGKYPLIYAGDLKMPVGYKKWFSVEGSGGNGGYGWSVYEPVTDDEGYVCVGVVVRTDDVVPSVEEVRCLPKECLEGEDGVTESEESRGEGICGDGYCVYKMSESGNRFRIRWKDGKDYMSGSQRLKGACLVDDSVLLTMSSLDEQQLLAMAVMARKAVKKTVDKKTTEQPVKT